jgi:nicotinamide-nucleotide amidase
VGREEAETREEEGIMKAGILSVGYELLAGKTINTNQAWLGSELGKIGIETAEVRVVPDEEGPIRIALMELWNAYPLVISTGGLGPTKDDITKRTIAECFGKRMAFSEEVWEQVKARFRHRNIEIPEINRCQAEYPEDFTLLRNDQGTAPGLLYESDGHSLYILPGVPYEMEGIFRNEILPRLRKNARPYLYRMIHTCGIAESAIAELFDDLVIPDGTNLAYLPQSGRVSLRVFGPAVEAGHELAAEVERRLAPYIWGYDDETIPTLVQQAFIRSGKTLSMAESCTGGTIQQMLTELPGSSAYFLGGIVTYANSVKTGMLGVPEAVLEAHGAVSNETVAMMAEECRKRFGTDVAGAISGIAGPDGGTEEKPVGTVYIAVADKLGVRTELLHLIGSRHNIRIIAAERVLLKILESLEV